MQERLQKILSARGICSRRKAEEYIEKGLVFVNGVPAEIGQKADPDTDEIVVDGQVIQERKELLYYLMNKPVGVITSNVEKRTDDDVPSIRDLLPKELQGKIYPVGRLDKETSGLLLLTNDGVIAYRLTHPKFDHAKEYFVRVAHPITDAQLEKLRKGMTISGERTKKTVVERRGSHEFTIELTEGKNRQIRRMCQKVGAPVINLERIRIMNIADDTVEAGDIRKLTEIERKDLLNSLDIGSTT